MLTLGWLVIWWVWLFLGSPSQSQMAVVSGSLYTKPLRRFRVRFFHGHVSGSDLDSVPGAGLKGSAVLSLIPVQCLSSFFSCGRSRSRKGTKTHKGQGSYRAHRGEDWPFWGSSKQGTG